MDPSDVAFVKGIITFGLVVMTARGAWRMWLQTRRTTPPELEPQIEALREDNAQLRCDLEARLLELEERVDFTERRMLQDRSPERLPGQTARTPV